MLEHFLMEGIAGSAAFSSFSHNGFKSPPLQDYENSGLFGIDLNSKLSKKPTFYVYQIHCHSKEEILLFTDRKLDRKKRKMLLEVLQSSYTTELCGKGLNDQID